jgi:short-subunit dehydrogenase
MKTILVTGSSSGFGKLIVQTLAAKGHTVYASMRSSFKKNKAAAEELTKWGKENKFNVHVIELDVTKDESVKNAIEEIINQSGRIDIVVNNAGRGNYGVSESFSIDEIKSLFEVNVFGPMRVNQIVLPHMRKQKSGLIIQISSGLGRIIIPFMGIYSGTKFAIEAISEGQSYELKSLGIDMTIIEPGGYPTQFHANTLHPTKELTKEYGPGAEMATKSMHQWAESLKGPNAPNPQEIADAVLKIIQMPQGTRPLRINVGPGAEGAQAINKVSEQIQSQILQRYGMK